MNSLAYSVRPCYPIVGGSPLAVDPEFKPDPPIVPRARPASTVFPYNEDLLQHIWERGLYFTKDLRTTDGREVEVLSAGFIHGNSGPDLIGARIRIDGQLWAGNVEVHVRSSAWNLHGHQRDASYDNVILHVVYENDLTIRTRSGSVPPILELKDRIPSKDLEIRQRSMYTRPFVSCAHQLGTVPSQVVHTWLEAVSHQRSDRRLEEINHTYHQLHKDPLETRYHVLARAFGMQVNADAFGMLALALPWRIVERYADDLFRLEALLFGQAGFLRSPRSPYARRLAGEHHCLAALHGLEPTPSVVWKFGRLRPSNFPTIRIAQFAGFLHRLSVEGMDLLGCEHLDELHRVLDVSISSFWDTHYRFGPASRSTTKRMGGTARNHVVLNGVIPLLYTFGMIHGRPELQEKALSLLGQLPVERNTDLKNWERSGIRASTAGEGQALLELRKHYCMERRCLSCGIGKYLLPRK